MDIAFAQLNHIIDLTLAGVLQFEPHGRRASTARWFEKSAWNPAYLIYSAKDMGFEDNKSI